MFVVRSLRLVVLAAVELAQLPAVLAQPFPAGPQFQVNSYTTQRQYRAQVAADGAGNFVVVWESDGSTGSDTGDRSIQGQRYDTSGTPLGSEFQVNTYSTGNQQRPAVAIDGAGNFIVVWDSNGSDGSDTFGLSIQGQRYDSNGIALGSQFQVNLYTTSTQSYPAVSADTAGNFIVVWTSFGSAGTDGSALSIQGQRYNSTGVPVGSQFQVNTYTPNDQNLPRVAVDGTGDFVVAWSSQGSPASDSSYTSVQARRYDSTGAPMGSQFQVNNLTSGYQDFGSIAVNASGTFFVAWRDSFEIEGRFFDSAGTPLGGDLQVNTYVTGYQISPAASADGLGNFIVVWDSVGNAKGQRYDGTGTPLGGEFGVNQTTLSPSTPTVAADSAGNFVAVWGSSGSVASDDDDLSIQGQLFGLTTSTSTTSTSTSTSSTTTTTLPPTDLLPGKITFIKLATVAKFVAKPLTGDTFAPPSADPTWVGGSLRFFDTAATAGDNTYTLPNTGWKALGNPPGAKGYKYRGAGTFGDPCKVVLLKATVIKGICKGVGVNLAPPFTGDVGIILDLGTTDRYCARFGGDVLDGANTTKRKNAPAPGACP